MLTHDQARLIYDRFAAAPDWPRFYKRRPTADAIKHGVLDCANQVLEFGCGRGKFAEQLLSDMLSESAQDVGLDQSPMMVRLTRERLARFGSRAAVIQTSGEIRFPVESQSQDRVVSNYALDLLSEEDIRLFLQESHRVLRPAGRLCIVGLSPGVGACSRLFSRAWAALHRVRPELVGGCRPVFVGAFVRPGPWKIRRDAQVTVCCVSSEVLVLEKSSYACPPPDNALKRTAPGHDPSAAA
ncbi:MAG TPA: class I SAM-dependent methyltransferase [Vicinamibacterales bacterium]